MGQFITNFIAFTIGMFIGLLAMVYLWMSVFVSWLGYDYVQASSIYFVLGVTGIVLNTTVGLFRGGNGANWISAVIGFLIYPLLFSGVLLLYETWSTPQLSDATNVVAMYRELMVAPLTWLSSTIAGLGPTAQNVVSTVENSPTLSQIAALAILALFQSAFGMMRKATEN